MALTPAQIQQTIRSMVEATDPAPFSFSRSDITAAITAADAWATSNAASYNTALPDPFKSQATNAQKAFLLAYICLRRAGI